MSQGYRFAAYDGQADGPRTYLERLEPVISLGSGLTQPRKDPLLSGAVEDLKWKPKPGTVSRKAEA